MRSRKGRLFNKILAVFLALSFNVGIFDGAIRLVAQEWQLADFSGFVQSAWAGSPKGEKNKNKLPATAGKKEYKDPKEEKAKLNHEVKSKRTINSKTYQIGENEFKREVYLEPVHYANNKKELVDIDNTLVESKEKGFAYTNKANNMKVRFAQNTNADKLVQIEEGGFSLSWALLGVEKAEGKVISNTINYEGIAKNIDLRYKVQNNAVKEEIILFDKDTPNQFTFKLDNPNLKYQEVANGIEFINPKTNDVVWFMPKPFMYDAKGQRSDDVTAKISDEKGKLILIVSADEKWLKSSDRQYPVVIDPEVQPDWTEGTDTYISEASPSDNYRASDNLLVDTNTGERKFTFVRFNLDDPGKNVRVTDATFTIYAKDGDLSTVELQPVNFDWDWGTSTLTWNYYQDHLSLRGPEVSANGSDNSGWDFDATKIVEGWLNAPSTNQGLMLKGSGSGSRAFVSCDIGSDSSTQRPKLTYTYKAFVPVTEDESTFKASDLQVYVDKKTGIAKAEGITMKKAKVFLTDDEGNTFEKTADDTGKWSVTLGTVETGVTKTLTMKYQYKYKSEQIDPKTGMIKEIENTFTSKPKEKKFLITRYSKEARLKRLAKFYYNDGTKGNDLKEDNKVKTELYLVVGDYLVIMDPKRSENYTTGPIIKNPDAEYKLREKLKPSYANGDVIGNSVDAATGNFFNMEIDLDFDALGLSVDFSRTLNSQQTEMIRGPLGLNWGLGYNRMLVMYEDGSIEVTGGDGGGIFFSPTGDGVTYQSTDEVTDRLVKNSDGTYNLITEDDTYYQFNGEGMLNSITDSNNNRLTLIYNPEGLLEQVMDASGRTTNLTYDDEGRICLITDPENRQVEYTYDTEGRLTTIIDPEGGITTYSYEGYRIDKITDAENNVVVDNAYDSLGRVLAQVDAAGYSTSFNYGANRTSYIDENGEKFTYFYDSEYQITEINGPVTSEGTEGVTAQGIKAQSYSKASIQTSGALVHYEYDEKGNRTKVVDAKGNVTEYTYDEENNLKTVTDPLGNTTNYSYDSDNNLDQVIDANEKLTSMVYDSNRNLRFTTNPLGETTEYIYDDHGQTKSVTDDAGKTIKYNYDLYGNVKTTVDGNGNITNYEYDGIGRNIGITDARGYSTTFEYDDNGNLLKEISPGGVTINSYDNNGNLTGTKDPEGNVTIYQYDKRNMMVKEIDPLLNSTSTTYDKTGRQTAVTDAEGKVTKFEYDALGQMIKTIDPVGDIVEYFYDANGNRIGQKDAQGQYTKYEYDSLNRLKVAIDPLHQKTEYTYDAVGNTVNNKESDGTVTEYKYDSLARVIEIIDTLKKSTKFTYDASGNKQSVTYFLGQTYTYYYDGNNNLTKVLDPDGKITEFKYDANNNYVSFKDALGNETRYVYDKQNRLINVIDPLNRGNEFELDNNGNRTKVTDGNGNTTRYEYDAIGQLTAVVDAKNNETEYQYDKNGSLSKFIDAKGNATRYEYNLKNFLIKQINPLGQATKFEYDKNGNITAKIDAKGQRIEYAYDQINRLLGTYYPDGKYVEYGYNKQGKREWMEDNFGTSWYDYDILGRLTAVTNQDDLTMEYEYNALGQKSKATYPDGKDVKYDYDQNNRLSKVTDRVGKVTAYDYDSLGRRIKTTLPNGIKTIYDYDNANQLTAIASTNEQQKLLAKYQYEYDKAGNRVSIAETAEDQVYTTKYNYDPLNQLEEVLNPDGSKVGYQYDQVGNRTKMFNLAGTTLNTTNYNYDNANQLTKTNINDGEATRYEYDTNGNRVAKIQPENVVTKYSWDYENRLTNVLMHQGKFVSYEYDGDGNRIGKIAGVKQPLMKEKPNQGKVNKQQAEIISKAANNGNSNGGGNDNAGGNGNGHGNDKDEPEGDKNGNGKGKGSGKEPDKTKNKDLTKEERNKKKENSKQGKGYRQKGKYNNKGKHLGWYKNKNKNKLEQQLEETYYLNDVSTDLSQVMMTYNETGIFDTAYSYGVERIGIDILDGTRPDAQNPLYYLYDGQGSVAYITKPDGEKRDTYNYDEFGKPRTGKLSHDGDKILHTSFGYNGEQWDEESKLQYLRARYYEPETGRYISRDTYEGELDNPLSKHLYTYVQNNPVNYFDPTGHRMRGWDWSLAMFLAEFGPYYGYIVEDKWNNEIDDKEFFSQVGIKVGSWAKQKYPKNGKINSKDQKWTENEWAAAKRLASLGYNVTAKRTGNEKTFDWWVSGNDLDGNVKVELKTPNPGEGEFKHRTTKQSAVEGFVGQGATVVIVDMSINVKSESFDALDLFRLTYKVAEDVRKKKPDYHWDATIVIWTKKGFYYGSLGQYDPDRVNAIYT